MLALLSYDHMYALYLLVLSYLLPQLLHLIRLWVVVFLVNIVDRSLVPKRQLVPH
jgi:hypothetical protein